MTTTISNNAYWNNISFDQSFYLDDLFTSTYDCIHNNEYNHNSISSREEYKETSSSSSYFIQIDQEQSQTSLTNNSLEESHLPHLICGVCGAPANGYNFDQLTCESCKAFFRRNALRNMPYLKCRFAGSCVIDTRTRRQCTYCRLKKCFDIKMRKDWIRTEEEIELRQLQKLAKEQKKLNKTTNDQQLLMNLPIVVRKKKRLMIKPTIQESVIKPIDTQTVFGFNRNLSNDDRIILNNITNAYQLVDNQIDGFRLRKWTSISSLMQFINEETVMHQSLISFYKSLPEFNRLDIKDRVLLIKSNLIEIIHLHCIVMYKFQEDQLIGFYMSQWINEDFHQRMSRAGRYFNRFIEHPLILKLALIVFIFSINLSASYSIDPSDDYTNKITIREIQDFYTTVLWRYLNSVYQEKEAINAMEIIVMQILHYQKLMNTMESYLRQEPDFNKFNPLESSLFRLT